MNKKSFNLLYLFSLSVIILFLVILALSKYVFENIDYGFGLILLAFFLSIILAKFKDK